MRLVINAESNEGRKNNTSTKSDHQAARPADRDKLIHWHFQTPPGVHSHVGGSVCVCVFLGYFYSFLVMEQKKKRKKAGTKRTERKIHKSLCGSLFLSPTLIIFQIWHSVTISAFRPVEKLPPRPLGLFQPFTVWLTEIPEIQADGSSPWLMMSQADPFLCPLRSRSNPPQFPYVLHDKSHHAFLLTLLGNPPFFHFGPSPPEPGFEVDWGRVWKG